MILAALRLVLSGGTYVPPRDHGRGAPRLAPVAGAASATRPRAGASASRRASPTCCALLLAGKSNKADLAASSTSPRAPSRTTSRAVLKALNVDTRVQAVIAAAQARPQG